MNSEVVIVGGGIQGCASAYFLAKLGLEVTLLEKDWVSRHASGVNAGGVRMLGRHLAEVPLSKASMALWQRLDDELEADTGFRSRSLINIAVDDTDMETLAERERQMHALGHFHEKIIDRKDLRERLPHVAPHCVGGVVSEVDGYAIPYQATNAFRRAAERLGARFMEGCAVRSLRRVGACWLVETDQGRFETERLVNCAGAWADQLAVMVGDNVPMTCGAPMLMVTARMPHFATPVVGAVSRPLSFKQFENGTVLIGGGAKGFADRDNNRTRLDYAKLASGAKNAVEFFPIMKRATVNRMWAGLEAYLPDSLPVIGPSAHADNAWHAFGFSAHGFQMGPVVGQVVANLVATGRSDFDLASFRVDRFERKVL